MTSLRFVGDVPVWLALGLAVLTGALSWRYYNRESFHLPRQLKWFLPLLRSAAFFLGIMMLAGPVLHHRTIIGELGRVRICLDASDSMTMQDRHMSTGRKLLIAEQLGWLSAGHVDPTWLHVADELTDARREFLDGLTADASSDLSTSPSDDPPGDSVNAGVAEDSVISAVATKMRDRMKALESRLPDTITRRFNDELMIPLDAMITDLNSSAESDRNTEEVVRQLQSLAITCDTLASAVQRAFESAVTDLVSSGDESIRSALAMFDETPRWRRVELALAETSAKVLSELREKHDVEVVMLLGDTTEIRHFRDDVPDLSITDFGSTTDLSSGMLANRKSTGIADDSETTGVQPQTAVIVITDGQHNSGPSPLQTAQILGSQGVIFGAVSVGATQEAPDLAVISVEAPDLVFRKDRVRGVIQVRDRMPPGRPFVVQITHDDQVLWRQQMLTEDLSDRRIEFDFAIDELIDHLAAQFSPDLKQNALPLTFDVSVSPLAEESQTTNNQKTMRLAAIIQSHRVLILDGRSRWETRYLRNAFERDEQWAVNTIIAGVGTEAAVLPRGDQEGQFPADRDALFEYDLVILGEVAADLFTTAELDWLREFVEIRGGGIVFIDGQRGLLRQMATLTAGQLLPVEWLPDTVTSKPASLQLTEKGATESALKLKADDEQNRRFWTELPAPHSLVAVQALPGAEVLVDARVDEQLRPVIITRPFGAGRVLYLASDETWRWRYKAADLWHQRIWHQLARYVMPRPFAVSDEYLSLDSGPVRYDFGDLVDLRVRLLGLDSRPNPAATAEALLWRDGQIVASISLDADAEVPGIYRGRSGALPEGEYEVSVRASGYSESVLKARSRFVVLPPESGEMNETSANELLLRQMAAAAGGIYLREEQIGKLPELLSPLSNGRVVETQTLIWQSYWWFLAIVLLLTVEWIFRKRSGLL